MTLGLGLRPMTTGLGLEGCGLGLEGHDIGLDLKGCGLGLGLGTNISDSLLETLMHSKTRPRPRFCGSRPRPKRKN